MSSVQMLDNISYFLCTLVTYYYFIVDIVLFHVRSLTNDCIVLFYCAHRMIAVYINEFCDC